MSWESKPLRTADDVTEIRDVIEEVYDGWFAESRTIDWDLLYDKIEERGYDLGGSLSSPAILTVNAIVKELRKAA